MTAFLVVLNIITILFIIASVWHHARCRYRQKTFQRLIDHASVGYYRARYRDGVLLAANDGFSKILDLDPDVSDYLLRPLSELFISLDGKDALREELKHKKALKNYEYKFKTLKGRDKFILHNSYLIDDPYTGETVIEALIEDITEERLSYEKMKESQERYEKLFRSSGDMVIIFRLDNFIIEEINPIAEVITGLSLKDLVKSSFEELIHPLKRSEFRGIKDDLLFTGASKLSTIMVSRDGTYRNVIMTMSMVETEPYNVAMAVIKDISELAREHEHEKRREKELEEVCKAALEREERIRELRNQLEKHEKRESH